MMVAGEEPHDVTSYELCTAANTRLMGFKWNKQRQSTGSQQVPSRRRATVLRSTTSRFLLEV